MILGFKPYQSVGFQFYGVTRDKKIILINSRLLNVDFFLPTHQPRVEFQPLCEKYEFRMSVTKA